MSGAYAVQWAPSAKQDLAKLPEKAATAAVEFSYGGLAANPPTVGRPCTSTWSVSAQRAVAISA